MRGEAAPPSPAAATSASTQPRSTSRSSLSSTACSAPSRKARARPALAPPANPRLSVRRRITVPSRASTPEPSPASLSTRMQRAAGATSARRRRQAPARAPARHATTTAATLTGVESTRLAIPTWLAEELRRLVTSRTMKFRPVLKTGILWATRRARTLAEDQSYWLRQRALARAEKAAAAELGYVALNGVPSAEHEARVRAA